MTIDRDPVAADASPEPVPLSESSDGRPSTFGISAATALRWGALLVAVIPLSVLVIASRLEPSTSGIGTHQQLGLPPCSMRIMFSIRCPGCGMTTSWAHFTRGQWLESAQVNIGGFLLAWFSLLVAFLALRTFWTSQLPSGRMQQVLTYAAVGITLVTLVNWVFTMTNVQ